jgi:hypothetical protein
MTDDDRLNKLAERIFAVVRDEIAFNYVTGNGSVRETLDAIKAVLRRHETEERQ